MAHIPILTAETLSELEKDSNMVPMGEWAAQWWNRGPFLSKFDKNVLKIKPNDCPIVSKYSQIETFLIKGLERTTELSLATFYAPHPLREFHKRSVKALETNEDIKGLQSAKEQLNKIDSLPLIVFIHGLGGQMSQFEPLLQEFRNCADIFSLDLPGFGNSKRPSRNDDLNGVCYTTLSQYPKEDLDKLEQTLNNLTWNDFTTSRIVDIIYQILNQKFPQRNFIFISHSMGTHITLKLTNKFSEEGKVQAITLMTPPKLTDKETANQTALQRLPLLSRTFINTCIYTPKLFDWYRLLDRKGGFYSKSVDGFLYKGDENIFKRLTQYRWNLDTESEIFLKYLQGFSPVSEDEYIQAINKLPKDKTRILIIGAKEDKVTPIKSCELFEEIAQKNEKNLKYEIIEKANHSLFLDCPNIVSGIVYDFVEDLDLNISCTWVLQVKAIISGDKWGLKNKEKWDQVVTLSSPLINPESKDKPLSYLLGMKTLRQSDPLHNPHQFELDHPEIYGVVDIGSDTPAYDPEKFERIKYVKFKTESKVIPDNVTVVRFIGIVDELMANRVNKDQFIVVHCHYGQNRTGFLICCYLIEKLGWSPSEAIKAFESAKKPGIKHVHFKNALYLRYR